MRVLITGYRGFIGSWLTTELTEHGHVVFGHDLEEGDLTIPRMFADSIKRVDPDKVVHLAAQVGRLFGEDDVHHTVRSNAEMTSVVAHVCGQREIPVLYSSTSEVYGDQGDRVCYESGPVEPPHNLYGLTKYWGEQVLRLYAPEGLRIARLSMPYGPGAPPGRGRRAMDNFLWQAHHRMPITVHRNSERSWCWVGDTVRALRMILENGKFEVYNVGRDDDPRTMLLLAHWACRIAGASRSLIEEVPPPVMQTVVKRLSTAKIRGEFGWEPTVDLYDGMVRVHEWVSQFDADGKRIAA